MIDKILLIDDDEVNNFLNEKLIAHSQLAREVVSFTRVEDSIHYLDMQCVQLGKKPPELILLDISMPSMDGFDFIQIYNKLKIKKEKTTIVILSSSSDERDLERVKAMAVNYYLVKPLSVEKLNALYSDIFKP
jgi:CheY-like chemotaxis protein